MRQHPWKRLASVAILVITALVTYLTSPLLLPPRWTLPGDGSGNRSDRNDWMQHWTAELHTGRQF